jgi:hypothetical protein
MVLTKQELEALKPRDPARASREGTPTQREQDILNLMRTVLYNKDRVGGDGAGLTQRQKNVINIFLEHFDNHPMVIHEFEELRRDFPKAFEFLDENLAGKKELTSYFFTVCAYEQIHPTKIRQEVYNGTKPLEWVQAEWNHGMTCTAPWYEEAQENYENEKKKYEEEERKRAQESGNA